MTTRIVRCALTSVLFFLFSVASASAQEPFKAEIDCDGIIAPGADFSYFVEIENQTFDSIPMDVTIEVFVPNGNIVTLASVSITLGPNQDILRFIDMTLPAGAPSGNYVTTITAVSDTFTSTDTCSFQVP